MHELKQELRTGFATQLQQPTATQYVKLGPLRDDRTLNFQVEYHGGDGSPSISVGAQSNGYLVRIPRRGLIRSFLISDAMIGCSIEPTLCSFLEDYLEAIDQVREVQRLPFFDDVFPDAGSTFSQARSQPHWGASLHGAIESASSVVMLHEFCHAILRHLEKMPQTAEEAISMEGEADGCMLHLLKDNEGMVAGGLSLMASSVYREVSLGDYSFLHPRPSCRISAMLRIVTGWLEQQSPHDRNAANAGEMSVFKIEELLQFQNDNCAEYIDHARRGAEKAADLIDAGTELTSTP